MRNLDLAGTMHAAGTGRRRRYRSAAAALLAAGLLFPTATDARIHVDLVQIGIPTRDARQGAVRPGTWTPIVVDVSLEGETSFDGALRVVQRDGDGDQIVDAVEVHLLESAGGVQRYWLYTLTGDASFSTQDDFGIELLGADGQAVEVVSAGELTLRVVPEQPPMILFDNRDRNHALILAISVASGGRVLDVADGPGAFDREFKVGHVAPSTVPNLWIGLEAVDYVVWDEADPADMSGKQLEALLEWVRQGGTLLIAASGTAGAVAGSAELAAMLPVNVGDVVRMTEPGPIARQLFGNDSPVAFKGAMSVARCTARPGAFVYYRDEKTRTDLISRIRAGRGHVIYSGASLVDLFTKFAPRITDVEVDEADPTERGARRRRTAITDSSAREFYRRLFWLKFYDKPEEVPNAYNHPLIDQIRGPVQFPEDAGLYLLITMAFMGAYWALATFGSWAFLQRRGWQRHNWTAFTLIAVVAAFLGISTVEAVQGFGITVRQVSVVDAEAGARFGHGAAFFGLKTASHVDLDVWLPSDPQGVKAGFVQAPSATTCFLRPVLGEHELEQAPSYYTDPGRYELRPANAELVGVPFRATMKALEGRWSGPLSGRVTARVEFTRGRAGPTDIRFSPNSFVTNELGVDLKKCYLLYASRELYDTRTGDTASLRGRSGFAMWAIPLGDIKASETALLSERFDPDGKHPGDSLKAKEFLDAFVLSSEQVRWLESAISTFGTNSPAGQIDMRLTKQQSGLLLASTTGDFDPESHKSPSMYGLAYDSDSYGLRRGRLRCLDLRDHLRPDAAVLVGFAEGDGGPIRLATRRGDREYRLQEPEASSCLTLYRIRIPVTGRPPGAAAPRPQENAESQDEGDGD
ncbi:MAG: hypothetical protein C4547_00600 [Phycisphaerales bacterium]|nr:MAG: hypothetical protein C4547_00600 [Phycisphaerales bacterium]